MHGEFVCLSEVLPEYANLLQRLAFQASSGSRTASLQRIIPSCAADFALCLQNLSSVIVTYFPNLRSAWNLYTRYLMDLLKIISPAGVFGFDNMHRLVPVVPICSYPQVRLPRIHSIHANFRVCSRCFFEPNFHRRPWCLSVRSARVRFALRLVAIFN